MSVANMSCPQSLWLTLRAAQQPIEWPEADAPSASSRPGEFLALRPTRAGLYGARVAESPESASVSARGRTCQECHSRNTHVCSGRQLFRARERKNKIVGTIAEPRKAAVWPSILRTL